MRAPPPPALYRQRGATTPVTRGIAHPLLERRWEAEGVGIAAELPPPAPTSTAWQCGAIPPRRRGVHLARIRRVPGAKRSDAPAVRRRTLGRRRLCPSHPPLRRSVSSSLRLFPNKTARGGRSRGPRRRETEVGARMRRAYWSSLTSYSASMTSSSPLSPSSAGPSPGAPAGACWAAAASYMTLPSSIEAS